MSDGGDGGGGEDGPDMRAAILDMALAALRRERDPAITLESLRADPGQRQALAELLAELRPLPVVLDLIADTRAGRL